jgi:NADH-quinone oxidoreductase subunit L
MVGVLRLENLAWLVLLAPLCAAGLITLFKLRDGRASAQLSIAAVVGSFLGSLILFGAFHEQPLAQTSPWRWLDFGSALVVDLSLRLDALSLLMLLIVTGVGGAIHIYSFGYMGGDPGMGRYFAGLSLFTFAMLGIVLAGNFVALFVFWELVGVSSYLLIGFWFERPAAAEACKKAFLTNRLGDFGFLLGILVIWASLGTLDFAQAQAKLAADPGAMGAWSGLAGLLIFCGATGKSAQFPLHVWLPDAMEGPTPVSALIHAATMVAAGVYMLCRVFFLYQAAPAWPESLAMLRGISALDVIAWIGGLTALLAALIAVQQNDIKRILAYSTLSQLGYMVMAVGCAGPAPAMYHLTTHAFFKALLFLGAGAVIVSLHHEQDIWKMGGLRRKMPATYGTFLLATLALCGVPPFSGFFSKDEILATTAQQNLGLFVLAVGVAFLTTFYMTRLFLVAFEGAPRSESASHAHEAPTVMKWPLLGLAFPSVLAGFWGINRFLGEHFAPGHAAHAEGWLAELFAPFAHAPLAAMVGLLAVAFGLSFAWTLYADAPADPLPRKLGALARGMGNRFYFDEVYGFFIRLTHELVARLADSVDRWIIAGLAVRGTHGTTELVGRALRLLQNGNVQTYALLGVLGVVAVMWFVLG